MTKATELLDDLRALVRDNDHFDLITRSEDAIRRHWLNLTPADREGLDELIHARSTTQQRGRTVENGWWFAAALTL